MHRFQDFSVRGAFPTAWSGLLSLLLLLFLLWPHPQPSEQMVLMQPPPTVPLAPEPVPVPAPEALPETIRLDFDSLSFPSSPNGAVFGAPGRDGWEGAQPSQPYRPTRQVNSGRLSDQLRSKGVLFDTVEFQARPGGGRVEEIAPFVRIYRLQDVARSGIQSIFAAGSACLPEDVPSTVVEDYWGAPSDVRIRFVGPGTSLPAATDYVTLDLDGYGRENPRKDSCGADTVILWGLDARGKVVVQDQIGDDELATLSLDTQGEPLIASVIVDFQPHPGSYDFEAYDNLTFNRPRAR